MLKAIRDNLELFPKSFNSDFEKAFLNAVKNIFPNSILYGCYFHFRKCMRSKIQELGLTVEYRENKKIKDCLKLSQMLGFLPLDDVIPAFEEFKTLRIEDENVKKFYTYFENTFLSTR